MNSSQLAQIASLVPVLVAGLVLASAQLRVLRRPAPHRTAYLVGWIVSAIFLAAFRTLADYFVGLMGMDVVLKNLAWTAVVCGASLCLAHVLARPTFLRLLSMHTGIVLLASLLWQP